MTTLLGSRILELERTGCSLNRTQSLTSSSKPQSKQHKESNCEQYDDSCTTDWISVESDAAYVVPLTEEEQKSSDMSKRRRYIYWDEKAIGIQDIARLTPKSNKETRAGSPTLEVLPDVNDPNFFCRSCNIQHGCKISYKLHLARIHKLRSNEYSKSKIKLSDRVPEISPSLYCNVCRKQYSNRQYYGVHLAIFHLVNIRR